MTSDEDVYDGISHTTADDVSYTATDSVSYTTADDVSYTATDSVSYTNSDGVLYTSVVTPVSHEVPNNPAARSTNADIDDIASLMAGDQTDQSSTAPLALFFPRYVYTF